MATITVARNVLTESLLVPPGHARPRPFSISWVRILWHHIIEGNSFGVQKVKKGREFSRSKALGTMDRWVIAYPDGAG
jgi:hypothetical protein